MKSVALFAVLVLPAVGCTFSIQLENLNDDAARPDASADARIDTIQIDASPPIDAGPDAMPAWVQLEMITVSCDGTEVLSANALATGVMYRLRSVGECVTNNTNNSRGDAEYAYNQFSGGSTSGGIDIGLAINDTTLGDEKLPNWGSYQSSHMYTAMWTGLGARIIAKFHDPNYDNNSGSLTLFIDHFQ